MSLARQEDGGQEVVRSNNIHHNGGFGLLGAGPNTLIEDNEISYNNTVGYNPYWGAGGSKWVLTTGLIVRGNFSHNNKGPGLWTDIDNINTLYERNRVEDNGRNGVFYEGSSGSIIRSNGIRRNGNTGVFVSMSQNTQIYSNTLESNFRGITYHLNCGLLATRRFISLVGLVIDLKDNSARDNTIRVGTATGALANGFGFTPDLVTGFWMGLDRPSPDHANASVILLISAHLESGHYFNPHAQRVMEGKQRGAKLIVFDVRLSNTASMSDWWIAPHPGTEAALLLGFAFDDWQVVVETAQVLAGLVSYPPDNPFFIYHVKVWSILHQISALLLRLGVTEAALSWVISGLLGMLSFQGLALVIYALGRDALVAIGAVFLIYVSRASEYGVVYPIWLAGTMHTYGVFGLGWCVVALGLLGTGWIRSGAVVLGLSPAVHPSIGIWFGAVVAIALFSVSSSRARFPWNTRPRTTRGWSWAAAAAGNEAASARRSHARN